MNNKNIQITQQHQNWQIFFVDNTLIYYIIEFKYINKILYIWKLQQLGCNKNEDLKLTNRCLNIRVYPKQTYLDPKLENYQVQTKKSRADAACFLHILFKTLALGLIYIKIILATWISDQLKNQLIFLFIIIDFWLTKNYNGRKMLGVRWFFNKDPLGRQRFHFQFRVNQPQGGTAISKMFWITNFLYIFLAGLYFHVIGYDYNIDQSQIIQFLLLIGMMISSLINSFLFYKAVKVSDRKKIFLRKKCGANLISSFGNNSIISYL